VRSLVQDLKPSEALSVLTARIAEENEAHARRLIPGGFRPWARDALMYSRSSFGMSATAIF
jgi:hypothetical protein